MKLKEWCKEILPIIQAAAEGRRIQRKTLGDPWEDIPEGSAITLFSTAELYRIKPTNVRIGIYDVPEPLRSWEGVELGTQYYIPSFFDKGQVMLIYNNDSVDIESIENGVVHLDRNAAILHAKALLSLTQENTK